MTQRDFFTNVINANINDEMTQYAQDAITKLDTRNEKRKSTQTKSQKVNEGLMDKIAEFLGTKTAPTLCSEIATKFGYSTQKAAGLLGLLVKAGRVTQTEVKVPKVGKRKAYTLVQAED
jgi:response regulator of citrate/malate metabolism